MTDSEVRVGEALKDATLLALVMEEEAMSQGMQEASKSCKHKETDSPGEETQP